MKPPDGLLQGCDGLGFQDAAGAAAFRQVQTFIQVYFAVAEPQMVPRRLFCTVVDMEMYQLVPVRQDKRDVRFPDRFGMADIAGEAELRAFQQEIDGS